ncbi:beta-3-deoxy-D-manno-oct-2-ulosonic acid transferase [Novosphingobium sp. ERN07]|uniref:capsular polysaccharide export protein, LipB/KpsS family n=1 Tax=Novosphingobium sp. ERN07 TaxID=2726187 RepID=UPI001F0E04B0|nr:beta-3-deoxy-D-manno-oct-2-ulosonic acid transferase [Novosphingobium sp. ERN07]
MSVPTFLRAPPFPQHRAVISAPAATARPLPADALDLLRQARVGGDCWSAQDAWSALENAGHLTADGADERIAIAALLDLPVTVLTPGAYGVPGDSPQALRTRLTDLLQAQRYIDPFTGADSTFEATVALLAQWRAEITANRTIAAASGMAWWKRDEIRRFLWVPERPLRFVRNAARALAVARKVKGAVAVWPSRVSPALLAAAHAQDTGIVRIEDGFVRSVGLGSNLVPPASVVVDTRGIHFDPATPSDLEHILATTAFTSALTTRAQTLRKRIVTAGISKYAAQTNAPAPPRDPNRKRILVPAQVEDDMSVLAGGGGLTSNLELLRRVRALEPDAEIWFRPHPDVDAGHRKGAVPDAEALRYADAVMRGGGMAPLLDVVDAVHVLTSLTGFEALMRGADVTCHGTPFYAGWGLTRDLGAVPDRRKRTLTLDQLVAGVLILYPRYLDPVTGLPCPPEVLVMRIASAQATNRLGWVAPLRRWQGRFMTRLRALAG